MLKFNKIGITLCLKPDDNYLELEFIHTFLIYITLIILSLCPKLVLQFVSKNNKTNNFTKNKFLLNLESKARVYYMFGLIIKIYNIFLKKLNIFIFWKKCDQF